jgi:hypothetical protein
MLTVLHQVCVSILDQLKILEPVGVVFEYMMVAIPIQVVLVTDVLADIYVFVLPCLLLVGAQPPWDHSIIPMRVNGVHI